ncbi:MAG: helix-turn-helix transcriptional regulator [Gemmatimonadetes bacterium]|nr:helix-turn-helix transcriptional regulator [Gemmatimonadota bacterium]
MVRLRFPELLEAKSLTPYQVYAQSDGRITHTMAHRLARTGGRFVTIKAEVIDALADIFDVPPADLFTNEPTPRRHR